jgi:uncharacterized protein YqgQ
MEAIQQRLIKTGYDVATLFRALTWIVLMGDRRDPEKLIAKALSETRDIIEHERNGDSNSQKDRAALLRSLIINWFHAVGQRPDPAFIEMIVTTITRAVDNELHEMLGSNLPGENA